MSQFERVSLAFFINLDLNKIEMKTFKCGVLLLTLFLFSPHLNAQSSNSKSAPSDSVEIDEIKIDLTDSSLTATFQNKALPVSNIPQLDNYLKSNPDLGIHKALVIRTDKVDPERNRSLAVVLGKNKIQNVRAYLIFSK